MRSSSDWLPDHFVNRRCLMQNPNKAESKLCLLYLQSPQLLQTVKHYYYYHYIKKPGGKVRPARRTDNLAICLSIVGALTSRNSMGLHGL
jgi:hypothetical protein